MSQSHPENISEIIVIRPASGLSGDMLLAGFARLAGTQNPELSALAQGLGLPADCVSLEQRTVNNINGWGCRVSLPHEHNHRSLADIRKIIVASNLTSGAQKLASDTFKLLARAEGKVHGIEPDAVTFHEVGALDSILDICLVSALFDHMAPSSLVCGPLPLCDGTIKCSHGLLATPAPAVLELLEGVPVRGIATEGETVTPTAIALLKGLSAKFGNWPEMTVEAKALVYGTKILPNVANGVIFARGKQRWFPPQP